MLGLSQPASRIVTLIALACVLVVIVMAFMLWNSRNIIQQQKRDIAVATTTGKALDKASDRTVTIRQEQQEKQREVDSIEGSDQRLPDGYGVELERLRRK